MAKYQQALSQVRGDFFLTDGGIETTLIFLEGQDIPYFAAFHLFNTSEDENVLRKYFRTYAELARKYRSGLVLETATWTVTGIAATAMRFASTTTNSTSTWIRRSVVSKCYLDS